MEKRDKKNRASQLSIDSRGRVIKRLILFAFFIFLIRMLYITLGDIKLPPHTKTVEDRALRGKIVSDDNYTISRSIKNYSASIHTSYLDPKKRDFFLTLFSIYTDIPKEKLQKRFYTDSGKERKGWITLASNLDAKTYIFLRDLKAKLNRLKVFRSLGNNKDFYYGLTLTQVGESREYPLREALSPILGYTRKKVLKDGYKRIVGIKGIEEFYDKFLSRKQDGIIKGKRDALGYIIYNNSTKIIEKKNGFELNLNINLALQKNLDLILDYYKEKLKAKEVIGAIMKSQDSKILAIGSSNRYDPLNIKQNEIPNLQPKAITYAYEPGSVLKPITYAIAIENGVISQNTIIDTMGGKMWLGRFPIRDDDPFDSLKAIDIIVYSSNIGIAKIAWMLGRKRFRDGLLKFGLGKNKSGIDIGKEASGKLYTLQQLRSKINLATTAYGYGIKVTFAQLLKAYNTFNNRGKSKSPRAVNYLRDEKTGKRYIFEDKIPINPISQYTAEVVKRSLIEVVNRGTGKKAKTRGLEVGGKTGTAMIASNNKYEKRYHTSFFGFANDFEGNKYTIGVLVIEPDFDYHFASQSAVPVFKKIVDALVEKKFLKPNISKEEKARLDRIKRLREQRLRERKAQDIKNLKDKLKKERDIQRRRLERIRKEVQKKKREELKRKKMLLEKRKKEKQRLERIKRLKEQERKKRLLEKKQKAKEKKKEEHKKEPPKKREEKPKPAVKTLPKEFQPPAGTSVF